MSRDLLFSTQALTWISFGDQGQRDTIYEEARLMSLENFIRLSETDIKDMSDEFSKRTVAQGWIAFELCQTKLLIGIMHWIHDQDCCYRVASIQDIADAEEFKQLLNTSIQRAELRKVEDDQVDTISKAANPGKFRDERKWPLSTTYLPSQAPSMFLSPMSLEKTKIQLMIGTSMRTSKQR